MILKQHMESNVNLYPLSTSFVSSFTDKNIRDRTRWRAMLLNDFKTIKETEKLRDFILRITDNRLISIINETLPIRIDFLTTKGFDIAVKNHINNQIKKKHVSNIEVVGVLCLRYMYFVRNKIVHAEKVDSSFNIIPFSKEEKELHWCNEILQMLITDLINFNSNY